MPAAEEAVTPELDRVAGGFGEEFWVVVRHLSPRS
jgi:hypothetical protein